ncbi:MAG: hypothetical protein GY943_14515 [Chloroflexi bacterium]|nr:hypothetical protein [Chloroflexota bacterium]
MRNLIRENAETIAKENELEIDFYFIDPDCGLCYLRVPTWCPFRLQFYFNGHNALAAQLQREQIAFEQIENGFLRIDDFNRANELA